MIILKPFIQLNDQQQGKEQFKSISPVFEEDIYDAISMKTCVEKRVTIGAPGADAMKKVIEVYKKELNGEK